MKKHLFLFAALVFAGLIRVDARVTLTEVRTASDRVIVAFFTSDTLDLNEINCSEPALWKINGTPADSIHKYVMQANPCDHHIYLETGPLVEGASYQLETPYGKKEFTFREREVFCESIKTNQVGYSAPSGTRYANFAIWLGTGGPRKIPGDLPGYEVFRMADGLKVLEGRLAAIGADTSSGDYVYRIDLSGVPEGGPYRIAVHGYGCSYPFGVGGAFSRKLAYTIFRAQYLQRCGCPIHDPDIRKEACHTLIYDVDGPIGEANIDVKGDEPTFACYGGYHDAGDADRRAYHMANPVINLMIFEAFGDYFTDGQFHIPGDFDAQYRILNYENGIPDILDEAMWGTLAWEYLQNEDGTIHFGTETRGYPDPFAAPLDLDRKKYGTVKTDPRATCTGAGLFLHLARLIRPYDPERSQSLVKRGELAMEAGRDIMAGPERLYYHIQRFLLLHQDEDHAKIRELYTLAAGLKDNLYLTPGYSLNDEQFDNPAYVMSYVLADSRLTDPGIVEFFKKAIREAADANIAELRKHAYPVGNNSAQGGWGHNVRQPQYACAPLLQWKLSGEQRYFDAASELMDWKLGLNPLGICYVTGIGFHSVWNIHDRESAYTEGKGWGPKPGITVFGPGVVGWRSRAQVVPGIRDLAKERQYTDDRGIISFNEFTIFETMHYDALYTVLSGGGKWEGSDPFQTGIQ
jgi:endoglucanase